MSIRDVLTQKGDLIETVGPSRKLTDVVELFVARHISSVVVVDSAEEPLGIVTDQLVIQALADHGGEVNRLAATDVMQSPVPYCSADDSLSKAMQKMTNLRLRHLLVQDKGRTLGIVSIGDLVKMRIRDCEMESLVLRDMATVVLTSV